MSEIPNVYVYGLCNVHYDAFYIKGLKDFYGVKNVIFDVSRFPKFDYNDAMSIIIKYKNSEIKICIDSYDSNKIITSQLDWCDIYGKVNYKEEGYISKDNYKIIPIGPSFGIKIWNFQTTIFLGLLNYIRFYKFISHKRAFLSSYKAQYKRMPLEFYFTKVNKPKTNYIFFVSSIWQKEAKTNNFRKNFIETSKKIKQVCFEGGFAPRKDGNNLTFDNLVINKRYALKRYLINTKRSTMVFNTPAVLNCHGWKLGEFFALGKAILSTSFYNKMPESIVNHEHIYFLNNDSEMEMKEKIKNILDNHQLKLKLEKNSKEYFENYLMPRKVIERLNNSIK